MHYVSTRGEAPALGFKDAVLAGLATDGGLYVPDHWPRFEHDDIAAMAGLPYTELAFRVISRFTGDEIAPDALRGMIDEAYATFEHTAVTPLVQLDQRHFVLELFHGPTLAFKDVAMQFLARLMDHILAERGERATIIGATSGDTGGAAIEAFRDRARTDVTILFPHGRVSDVQRRQMTTVRAPNVHALAIDGTFDDAQALVKAMFAAPDIRESLSLSAVNSINWGRIVAQTVYYFAAGLALGAPHRPVSFCVPTGNFGNVFAGYVAARMGLPVERLVIATNANDILVRTWDTGRYEIGAVHATDSPSMDIGVSSNFERLLFDEAARDGTAVRGLMGQLHQSGAFSLDERLVQALHVRFDAGRANPEETRHEMHETLARSSYLLDPHTAVGLNVARRQTSDGPIITLATAHPAKFPDAVEAATGIRPDLPPRCRALMTQKEDFDKIPADLAAVRAFIENRSRAVGAGA